MPIPNFDTMSERLDAILTVAPDNAFIRYIVARLRGDDYRGMHVSQHNRLTLDFVGHVLDAIWRRAGTEPFAVPP